MLWTERIENIDGGLTPVLVDEQGERRTGRPGEIRFRLPERGRQLGRIEDVDLSSLELVDGRQYLDALGLEGVPTDGHEVYSLKHAGQTIHIPAALLLTAFVGRLSVFGDLLFSPTGLERGIRAVLHDGQARVSLPRKRGMAQGHERHTQERLLWFSCFPSARKMWSSVHKHAVDGRLGLIPANARIDASVVGLKPDDTIFATDLMLRRLIPAEAPLLFADSLRGRVFDFDMGTSRNSSNLKAFKESAPVHPAVKEDFDVPSVNGRWAMDEGEWRAVLGVLTEKGFRCAAKTKVSMDAALEKWGTGVQWQTLDGDARQIENTYRVWKMRGKWDILKRVLKELRPPHLQVADPAR